MAETEIKQSRNFWYCTACKAQNSREDGECQYSEAYVACRRANGEA